MINQNVFKFLAIGLVYFLLLILDGVTGVHTFSIGFLLCLAFFVSSNQVFLFILILGAFNDVRFLLPLGSTALVLMPYLFLFQIAIKFFRSRMIFLYMYICFASVIVSVLEYRQFIQPNMIVFDLLSGILFIGALYLLALRKFQNFTFSTKTKAIKF